LFVKLFNSECPNSFTIASATVVGDTDHFILVSDLSSPITLGGGASDSLFVRFDPHKQFGQFKTSLHIVGAINLPDTSHPFDTTIEITAYSTAEPPHLISSLSSMDFGSLSTCHGLRDSLVTFVNTGCTWDTIVSLTVGGAGFMAVGDSLPIIVKSGDSVSLHFRFVPPSAGTFPGTIDLSVTSMGQAQKVGIPLHGVGVQGVGILDVRSTTLQAGSFSFCAGDTALFDTIKNVGCDTLRITNIRVAGDAAFAYTSSMSDTLLAPGSTKPFAFNFAPRKKGAHHIEVTFHSRNAHGADTGKETTITADGIGLPGYTALSCSLASADFGAVYACQQRDTVLWLRNTGCDTLTVSSGLFSNPSYWSDRTYPLILPPDSSAPVHLFLSPDTTGHPLTISGSYSYFSNADSGKSGSVPFQVSVIYPVRLHLALLKSDSGAAGKIVTFAVVLSGEGAAGGALHAVTGVTFDLSHNDNLLSYLGGSAGLSHTRIAGGDARATRDSFAISGLPASDTIGTLTFQVFLTDARSTSLQLSNVTLNNSAGVPNECIASLDDSGAGFAYIYSCADGLIQQYMQTGSFIIESVTPNPASNSIEVRVQAGAARMTDHVGAGLHAGIQVEMYDVLGHLRIRNEELGMRSGSNSRDSSFLIPNSSLFKLNVSSLSQGVYYLRLSEGREVVTRRVVVAR
jgi:hypothetical protein